MNRREALSSVGIILGGTTIIGSQAFLTACSEPETKSEEGLLTDQQIDLLNEFAEVILPKTDKSPGAKEVNVGSFMNAIVSDFYTAQEQNVFLNGVKTLADMKFSKLSDDEKVETLKGLEKEAGDNLKARRENENLDNHYYVMVKQLAIWGYLSSEAVATTAFNHMIVTPKFEGCVPFEEGDKALFREAGAGQARGYATNHMSRS